MSDTLSRFFSVFGSRKTPADVLDDIERLCRYFIGKGLQVRCGPCREGPDFRAVCVANQLGGLGYAQAPMVHLDDRLNRFAITHYGSGALAICRPLVEGFNDLPIEKRHWWAATAALLMGFNVDEPSRFAIIWTPDGACRPEHVSKETGLSARGILLAHAFGIPVFNLARDAHRKRLLQKIAQ